MRAEYDAANGCDCCFTNVKTLLDDGGTQHKQAGEAAQDDVHQVRLRDGKVIPRHADACGTVLAVYVWVVVWLFAEGCCPGVCALVRRIVCGDAPGAEYLGRTIRQLIARVASDGMAQDQRRRGLAVEDSGCEWAKSKQRSDTCMENAQSPTKAALNGR